MSDPIKYTETRDIQLMAAQVVQKAAERIGGTYTFNPSGVPVIHTQWRGNSCEIIYKSTTGEWIVFFPREMASGTRNRIIFVTWEHFYIFFTRDN